jgi:hypothetical protein
MEGVGGGGGWQCATKNGYCSNALKANLLFLSSDGANLYASEIVCLIFHVHVFSFYHYQIMEFFQCTRKFNHVRCPMSDGENELICGLLSLSFLIFSHFLPILKRIFKELLIGGTIS